LGDLGFALLFGGGVEFAEVLAHGLRFEVDALDFVIGTATFDGAPLDDAAGGGAHGVAQVGLFEDFFVAGAGAAIGEELGGGDFGAAGAVDGIDEAKADGVGEGDAEVDVPRSVEG
jgi:hypothetical protein